MKEKQTIERRGAGFFYGGGELGDNRRDRKENEKNTRDLALELGTKKKKIYEQGETHDR